MRYSKNNVLRSPRPSASAAGLIVQISGVPTGGRGGDSLRAAP